MHEIITLQLGHQANYVGTHFWNTQESYFTYGQDEKQSPVDHDVHFRAGIGAGGIDTFMPRALIYDLKGGFGSMRRTNALYEMEEDPAATGVWDHPTVVQRETPIEPVPYQKDLEAGVPPTRLTPDTVRYWSDFNRMFYHPRSMIQINEYMLHSDITPFEGFELGRELFKDLNREHDLIDRDFRLFAEECDQMQGIQVITSADDSWGGFAAEYMAELGDEYGKIGTCTWGLERGDRVTRDKQLQRTVALANTLSTILPFTSLYVPVRNPPSRIQSNVELLRTCQWHTSALISTAIESVTLPTRLHGTGGIFGSIGDIAAALNTSGRQTIGTLSMALCGVEKSDVNDTMISRPAWRPTETAGAEFSWEPEGRQRRKKKDHVFAQTSIVRGFDPDDEPEQEEADQRKADQRKVTQRPDESDRRKSIFRSPLAYPILDSFPAIFPTYGLSGAGAEETKHFTAVDAGLSTSSQVIGRLTLIKDVVSRTASLEERETLVNDLGVMIEAYEEGWNSDSEDSDD